MKTLLLTLLLSTGCAWAAPGAHGPSGEHLDGHSHGASSGNSPRLEAQSELFELVARLQGDELSILVDRYETNEPVLGASVEVTFGSLKAAAKFHSDHGDYAVDDKAMLKALSAPGEHGLVFTVKAGDETDLLDGTLVVSAEAGAAGDHNHLIERLLIGLVVLLAAGIAWWVYRRRRLSRAAPAALASILVAASLSLIAAPGAHGPGGEHLGNAAAGNTGGLARLPDGSVNVPKAAQRRMEIRTAVVGESEVAASVELPGRVVMDPNAGGRVQPVHGGRIEPGPRGLPASGQLVKKGDVLAYVRHHAEPYAEANQKAQLAQLRADRAVLEQRVKRLESLEGSVPRKDIDAARVELASLVERESRVNASLSSREAVVAPVSGSISVANAIAGQVVEPRDVLFEVVDPARALVEVALSDPALAQRIEHARLSGVDGVKLSVVGVGRALKDGLLPVTFRAETAKGEVQSLAVGQPVQVIALLRERTKGIVLPAESLARSPANEPVVWIKAGAERFIAQPVRYKALDAKSIVVTEGLGLENRVVVRGASLISQIR